MGGHDPYSASKGAAELVTASYARSFLTDAGCAVASVRAGNVIGGGDWAEDRLAADIMRALLAGDEPVIRNPDAVRPWQHVLDPLHGYLLVAEHLIRTPPAAPEAWNFGPDAAGEVSVRRVADMLSGLWGGGPVRTVSQANAPHEAHVLRLDSGKARRELGWAPRLPLPEALAATAAWYRAFQRGEDMASVSRAEIDAFAAMEITR
jgi:CDP-glucose 4,6-dehydratase